MDIGPSFVLESHPFARYRSEGGWADGVRPPHIVESVEDIIWLVEQKQSGELSIACGGCGERFRHTGKKPDAAIHWFRHVHKCAKDGVPIDQWLAQ